MTNLATSPGCFLFLAAIGAPTVEVPVTSFAQASAELQKYRDEYDVSGRTQKRKFGHIYGADHKTLIARVSYNGRVWDTNDNLLEEASQ